MFEAKANPFLVPFDGSFNLSESPTLAGESPDKKAYKKRLEKLVDELDDLQRRLYAADYQ